MAPYARVVNLDAMIPRMDLAVSDGEDMHFELVNTLPAREFGEHGQLGPLLRKPDFQRETNHWTPEQVASFLECFVNGDLIPSVILWRSPTHVFVIDGGHRLSAIRAWVEDDYGDGPISLALFGARIPREQLQAAKRVRELLTHRQIPSWTHLQRRLPSSAPDADRRRGTIAQRGLQIQWVTGNADKAEASFFKINTKGTPLDDLEELLLRNRKRPVPIAARAVIRAGMGHKYWSAFDGSVTKDVVSLAEDLHGTLFEPDLNVPVKTLELPLGGARGVRTALNVLIEFLLISVRNQEGKPRSVDEMAEDVEGTGTLQVLRRASSLANWISGNDAGSLGLHAAVYFYGPTGRHSSAMFVGMATLIAKKLSNNDKQFFRRFTAVRGTLEDLLVEHKDLIATIMQRTLSQRRSNQFANLIDSLVSDLEHGVPVTPETIVKYAGLSGKIVTGDDETDTAKVSDDTKSAVFIAQALRGALRCPICGGYLDPAKSVSYDHVRRVREGGFGNQANIQMTHPYCNQSVKS